MTSGPSTEDSTLPPTYELCHSPTTTVGEPDVAEVSKRNMKRKRLARLVSQDEAWVNEAEGLKKHDHPCLSSSPSRSVPEMGGSEPVTGPSLLQTGSMLRTHIAALRLEAELHPMRLIVARLMAHPTHNRKGIFNQPVDAVALGLVDYFQIVTRPMDLGTVKRKLHAIAYQSRQQAADDIRLTFQNSIRYNPPFNPVHKAATELLHYFEEAYQALGQPTSTVIRSTASNADCISSSRQTTSATLDHSVRSENEISSVPCSTAGAADVHSLPVHSEISCLSTATPPGRSSRHPILLPHACGACRGRLCQMCNQGCLSHEPALLVCQGVHCGGAKIRKGSVYYISTDGHRQYCERCYVNLTPVLPGTAEGDSCRYKQDLLKRKNDEEIAEKWLNCTKCDSGVHVICALHNGFVHGNGDFFCFECRGGDKINKDPSPVSPSSIDDDCYTFMSGSDVPIPMTSFGAEPSTFLSVDALPKCSLATFIEKKVAEQMKAVSNADKTIAVRVISDCSRHFQVPDVIRRHFRMATTSSEQVVKPPSRVRYQQKAIALFQKIDGLDVCIYCMFVQEYEGNDDYDNDVDRDLIRSRHDKRVYIAYIDSVEHFRPRECRTQVYHEIMVSYLATARVRGFETAQIWACPPCRGNSFVFWNHPASQRTPTRERLVEWYHGALSRAIGCGVVTDVQSLYESEFEKYLAELTEREQAGTRDALCGRMICPPLLEGDFWVDEAVRVHEVNLSRNIKVRAPSDVCVWHVTPLSSEELDPCPALQIAALVKDRVMTHPSSVPFRRPVNAAALKLRNYHEIVTNPMDLGTIYAQCAIGEYQMLREVVDDINLMVSNAKKFNPVGHFVHLKADEVLQLFFQELSALVRIWDTVTCTEKKKTSWEDYAEMSMSLDTVLEMPGVTTSIKTSSVVIEDDRSSDGSRSVNSSVGSVISSPMSGISTSKDEDSSEAAASSNNKRLLCASKVKSRGKSRRRSSKKLQRRPAPKKLDLLSDGPAAVMQSMVGTDYWLLDKRNSSTASVSSLGSKRQRSESGTTEEIGAKRRRQSWVGEEVSEAVRRARTTFFTCSLLPSDSMSEAELQKLVDFKEYTADYCYNENEGAQNLAPSPISEARHAFLEFSQYRHFEFDTLRRAKYSTAQLLYHLVNTNAPGVVPVCTSCDIAIEDVRWHKVKKVSEKRRVNKFLKKTPVEPPFVEEELCGCCHSRHVSKEEFIPIPVSVRQIKR